MKIEDIVEGGYYLIRDKVYHVLKIEPFLASSALIQYDVLDKMGNVTHRYGNEYLSRDAIAYWAEKRVQPRVKK